MRRAVAAATLVLAASGLAACSEDEPAAEPPAITEAEKGEEVDADAFLGALSASFEDGAAARVAFVVQGPTRVRGRGVVRYAAEGMEVDVRISDWQTEGGWISLRTVGGSSYMKVPESRGLWVDIGAADAGPADSLLADADPRQQLEVYRDQLDEVRFSAEETVAGVRARRYQLAVGADVTEYWFDEAGRVVRRANEVEGGRASFSWLDWEAEIAIEKPPTDRVITLQELERLRHPQGQTG